MPSNTLRRGLIWGSKCLNKIQFQNDRENDQSNKKKKHKIEILYDDRIRNPSTQLVNPIYNQRSCHRRLGVALMNCISHSCILCYQNCWALYLLLVANCSPLQRAMYKNIQEYTCFLLVEKLFTGSCLIRGWGFRLVPFASVPEAGRQHWEVTSKSPSICCGQRHPWPSSM